ncbi:dehydrase and lipid transport-domain-containing protein, partial [Dunaliella salina]
LLHTKPTSTGLKKSPSIFVNITNVWSAHQAVSFPTFSAHEESAKLATNDCGASSQVRLTLEKTSWNSRKLFASVNVAAPEEQVWRCLNDYEGLANFIPSLVENKCLEKKENGAILYQVGAQEVSMGVSFSASCTLDCTEFPNGVPAEMCSDSGDGSDGLLPYPKSSLPDAPSRDIAFTLVEGDFKDFRGIWRTQPNTAALNDKECSVLSYALYVKPQRWLPVRLIQNRIEKEVLRNLGALRDYAQEAYLKSA